MMVKKDQKREDENSIPSKNFNIEDLIINPAGTNGQRLLLLSIGFGVDDEEKLKYITRKRSSY